MMHVSIFVLFCSFLLAWTSPLTLSTIKSSVHQLYNPGVQTLMSVASTEGVRLYVGMSLHPGYG